MSEASQISGEGSGADIVQFPGGNRLTTTPDQAPEPDQTIDAKELSRKENVDWLLSELAHPARRRQDPAELADYALTYLNPFLSQEQQEALTPQDFDRRRTLLMTSVETILLPDEQIEEFAAQDEIYAALDAARTSLGKDNPGLKERRKALLALEELRMGVVITGISSNDTDWQEITRRLGSRD